MRKEKEQDHIIVAIHVTDRVLQAGMVQSVLTKYGGNIKTRIGLHELAPRKASPAGVILLELVGTRELTRAVLAALKKIRGVEAKSIVFAH